MKTTTKASLLATAIMAAASVGFAKDDKTTVAMTNVPSVTQQAINEASKTHGPVKKVHQRMVNGQTVYTVEFEKNNAINPRIDFTSDGTLLSQLTNQSSTTPAISADGSLPIPATVDGGVLPYNASLRREEVPSAVQATIDRRAAGREVADIDRETWDGKTVYEVEFRQTGKNEQIHITEDGAVVKHDGKMRKLGDWFKGTQFSDTPTAVQDTIRREAGGMEIVDIDREGTKENPVYEVEIRGADKKDFELVIAMDGSILRDSRKPGGALSMK
ncbi:MAG TPA: hypothetical protein PLN52_17675 [Opitutaceae bacterium]|nr:hypothetical protein [Opitutaceae bacterium]